MVQDGRRTCLDQQHPTIASHLLDYEPNFVVDTTDGSYFYIARSDKVCSARPHWRVR
jgi:hypothetical protein